MKVFFLDRDGVINRDTGYVHTVGDYEMIDGVVEALQYLQKLDYKFIIVTNQSGIGRGLFSQNDFNAINDYMIGILKASGIDITAVYHCPHKPDEGCDCRKPAPGMIHKALNDFENIDLTSSWMVGDRDKDIELGQHFDLRTIQVRSGQPFESSKADFVLDSLADIEKIVK
jgi:D-glycero-D-manno-heptose 1,7-bisphosphate phosphatase